MALYEIQVVEVQHVTVTYRVEADDPEEAVRLADMGETVNEEDLGCEVHDRTVISEPKLVEESAT